MDRKELKERLFAAAEGIEAKVSELRRRIHAHPEPGYEEFQTSLLAAGALRAAGIETRTGVAGTGVVGVVRGARPGRCVLLRADMDALHKEEGVPVSARPHRSARPGLMHACGHDGHVAMLTGAAEILAGLKADFAGSVKLVFQPAEEGGRGGERMVREGVLDDPAVEAAFALHAWPELPCGVMGFQYGTSMAASSDFVIEVTGRSGHAAFPHLCVDPVPAAAQIITALQTIRSREVAPVTGSVVSVTVLESGTKTNPEGPVGEDPLQPSQTNIVPPVVRLRGTSRSFTVEGQDRQMRRIEEIARDVARAHRAETAFAVGKVYPPTVHDKEMTDFAAAVASDLLGPGGVAWASEPTMGGEDFSYYLQKVPGTFVWLGTGRWTTPEERETEPGLHADDFDFNDAALVPGMALMAGLALRFLERA